MTRPDIGGNALGLLELPCRQAGANRGQSHGARPESTVRSRQHERRVDAAREADEDGAETPQVGVEESERRGGCHAGPLV